jgi:hypothetical protein
LIAPVLKTGRPKGLVSSNLTPSASLVERAQEIDCITVSHDNATDLSGVRCCALRSRAQSFQAGDGAGNRDRTITSEARSRSNLGGLRFGRAHWNALRSVGISYDHAFRINLTHSIWCRSVGIPYVGASYNFGQQQRNSFLPKVGRASGYFASEYLTIRFSTT